MSTATLMPRRSRFNPFGTLFSASHSQEADAAAAGPKAPAAPDIVLDALSLTLNGQVVINQVSARLTERRIAIIGRNGSGKSSLLRLIAGLATPTGGSVLVNGAVPAEDRAAMLAAIGILFQNPDHQILFPTVEQELAFGLMQQGHATDAAAARVAELLAAEGRSHWAGRATHTLSQGQRQYLCLMAILLMSPATILLDEPFAGLDLPTRYRLQAKLDGLPQQTILVTHNPEDLRSVDRVIWMDAGRIVADGAPETIIGPYLTQMKQLGEADAHTDITL